MPSLQREYYVNGLKLLVTDKKEYEKLRGYAFSEKQVCNSTNNKSIQKNKQKTRQNTIKIYIK